MRSSKHPAARRPALAISRPHRSDDANGLDPEWAWSPFEPSEEQPWNLRLAAHLSRRAGFGNTPRELRSQVEAGYDAAIETMFSSPTNDEYSRTYDSLAAAVGPRRAPEPNVALWLYAMLHSPDQLLEKTTLFWHGHFATSAAKVTNPKLMLDQNRLLREHALEAFAPMVRAISRDPAMLTYLDSTDNRKTHPNENYARELMELFCLGVGNYSEQDIQEVARCFTGWEVRREVFRFNQNQHDFGVKQVLGRQGEFDGDEAIDIILAQPAAARFIATKLLRYFVADFDELPDSIVEPLAIHLRETEFDLSSTIRKIISSNLFYSESSIGRKIRSPLELVVGTMRMMEASTNLYEMSNLLNELGQRPLYPPNVKGWDGGRVWINSATQLARLNFVHRLVHRDEVSFEAGGLAAWLDDLNVVQPNETVDFLVDHFIAVPLTNSIHEQLVSIAQSERSNRDRQLQVLITTIGSLPEFQLG